MRMKFDLDRGRTRNAYPSPRRFVISVLAIFAFSLMDLATKRMAEADPRLERGRFLVGQRVYLKILRNKDLDLVLWNGRIRIPESILAVFAFTGFTVFLYRRSGSPFLAQAPVVLILAGIGGNGYQIFFDGYVTDFIGWTLRLEPFRGKTANFADLYILIGLLGLLVPMPFGNS